MSRGTPDDDLRTGTTSGTTFGSVPLRASFCLSLDATGCSTSEMPCLRVCACAGEAMPLEIASSNFFFSLGSGCILPTPGPPLAARVVKNAPSVNRARGRCAEPSLGQCAPTSLNSARAAKIGPAHWHASTWASPLSAAHGPRGARPPGAKAAH
jgi:hypothetical protein